ncbi:MAG: putative DNA binding domain-containing protein [Anaerolineae bacterium]|nr:putative DNA binding domain-containing protein [Anaerolineae bacterium]
MDRDELIERLRAYEWNDIEFKAAQQHAPRSAYETVSAFANTAGGWLVFGVRQTDGSFEVIGVIAVDQVQNEFISTLRSGKVNQAIAFQADLVQIEGKPLLVFYIPEAPRQEKPVFLDGDIRNSFIRRGGCDLRCAPAEIERFVREASSVPYDSETVDVDPGRCFDPDAVQWYRSEFQRRNPQQDQALSDVEFLHHWGLLVEVGAQLKPTRASVLLFGTVPALLQVLPRAIVDCQWHNNPHDDLSSSQRFDDRWTGEVNLVQSWRGARDFYLRHAESAFHVDPETLQRTDLPPDYISFREALVNLLMHQDFGDQHRTPLVAFFQDRTVFWNPGDAFLPRQQLLEPGEKTVRNPRIVGAFRRIGLSEQAGTGLRAIFHNWAEMGWVPPVVENDKGDNSFRLTLLKQSLFSEEQILFRAQLGVRLGEDEAKVLALVYRQDHVDLIDAKAVTGLPGHRAQAVLDRLVTQVLLERVDAQPQPYYLLAGHLRATYGRVPGAAAVAAAATKPGGPLHQLSADQWRVVLYCDVPRKRKEIKAIVGIKSQTAFLRDVLQPLLDANILRRTHPDQLTHPQQSYLLTEFGVQLKDTHLHSQPDNEPPASSEDNR